MELPGLHVYIGYDSTEDAAAQVCAKSIRDHTSIPVSITMLKQDELRKLGLYNRVHDEYDPVSTEFAFTRFLVPLCQQFKGYALFVDCDFLFTRDIKELVDLIDPTKAVSVVKHYYTPKRTTKMDGKPQSKYPRKNWSSLMFFNCSHADTQLLTKFRVNYSHGSFLHRLTWAQDKNIGEIPLEWNWLVGEYEDTNVGLPAGIHFTNGGPWHEHHRNEDWGYLWDKAFSELNL